MNARANNLGILYLIIPSERIKTRAKPQGLYFGLISGMRSSVNSIIPLGVKARYFRLSEQAQNISVFQSRWKSRSFLCVNATIIIKHMA